MPSGEDLPPYQRSRLFYCSSGTRILSIFIFEGREVLLLKLINLVNCGER
jgi:hypothetical protein